MNDSGWETFREHIDFPASNSPQIANSPAIGRLSQLELTAKFMIFVAEHDRLWQTPLDLVAPEGQSKSWGVAV
ncbi:MAG: hypothetical protein ACK5TO_08770 [Planctomycetaceae bacterium]